MRKIYIFFLSIVFAINVNAQQFLDDEPNDFFVPEVMIRVPINPLFGTPLTFGLEVEKLLTYKTSVYQRISYAQNTFQFLEWEEQGNNQKDKIQGFSGVTGLRFYQQPGANVAEHTIMYSNIQLLYGTNRTEGEKVFGINCANSWECDYWQADNVVIRDIRYGLGGGFGVISQFGKFIFDINGGLNIWQINKKYIHTNIDLSRVRMSDREDNSQTNLRLYAIVSLGYILR